jgi:hypothetical protein
MKRVVSAFFLILGAIFTVSGQEEPIDLVLLLDTSSSMSASYRELNDYMTGKFLRDFLRTGDTFHLIPFSVRPRVDISRRIEGRGDMETIIGRMLLQYPLEPWSDIAAALSFAENYVSTLPARPKKIVLLTDGDSSPQPGSSSQTLDAAGLERLIGSARDRLSRRGISLDYIKVSPGSANPLANLPSPGRDPQRPGPGASPSGTGSGRSGPDTAPAAGQPPGGAPPPVAAGPPPAAGQRETAPATGPARAPSAGQGLQTEQRPGTGQPPSPVPGGQGGGTGGTAPFPDTSAADPTITGTFPGGSPPDAASSNDFGESGPTYPLSSGTEESETADAVELSRETETPSATTPADRTPPSEAPVPARPAEPFRYDRDSFSLPLIVVFVVLGLAALGLILFLVTRQLQGSPSRTISQAASRPAPEDSAAGQFTDHSAALASYAANQRPRTGPYTHQYKPQNIDEYEGPLMLNLFVEDQNTFIGKRNIHALKPGHTFTVGGGNSDFLIFLVPIPPHIGEVRCEGNHCTFIPRKAQYFPDIGSQQVSDCIGKTIRIISDKKYEIQFRLERYEDPLKALNRLLHSLQIPG